MYDNTIELVLGYLASDIDDFDARYNYWGTADVSTVDIRGDVVYAPYYLDEDMTELSNPITSINVIVDPAVITVGEISQAEAEIIPSDATVKKVAWSVEPEGAASIDDKGLITPSGTELGEVKIIAQAKDGSKVEGIGKINIEA